MSIQTNLSVSPYFDDYDSSKDYYRILFKPSTAVQVRELNQLQTTLQQQVERFGDHILKRGTLLNGCQPTFDSAVPFVKIRDVTVGGRSVDLRRYKNLFVRDSDNLTARIIETVDGFEQQSPDLKTLYLRYINSGDSQDRGAFEPNRTLTIFNSDLRLYDVRVADRSREFSNADSIVVFSAFEVQTPEGRPADPSIFPNGTILTQEGSNAPRCEVFGVDTTANTVATVVRVKPLSAELAIANTDSWAFAAGSALKIEGQAEDLVLSGVCGSGATAAHETTSGDGGIRNVSIDAGGRGYYVLPHVTISKVIQPVGVNVNDTITNIDNLRLQAQNFLAQVSSVPTDVDPNPIGFSYHMSVTEGAIYQKGHFLRVAPQATIVSKYTRDPSDIAVGFETKEAVANSAIDNSLLDNAGGFTNENAPGADRLQLTPRLITKTTSESESDPEFFPIFRFSEGRVYTSQTSAVYNKLGSEMARRTYEESGNFVLDHFHITTRSTTDFVESSESFSYIIDPGHAYVGGYRVKTEQNFAKNVPKGMSTVTQPHTGLDAWYGNYIRVSELGGMPTFQRGEPIDLFAGERNFYTDFTSTLFNFGLKIGTARTRAVILERGTPGTPDAVYRVYLFDIKMSRGRNFRDVRSVGVPFVWMADVELSVDRRTGRRFTELHEPTKNSLLFDTKLPLHEATSATFDFRTTKITTIQNGSATVDRDAETVFPYNLALSPTELKDIVIVPEADIVGTTSIGDVTTVTTESFSDNPNLITLTGNVPADVVVGSYISIDTGIVRVTAIPSPTQIRFESSTSSLVTPQINDRVYRVLPANIPIPLAEGSVSVNEAGSAMTVSVGVSSALAAGAKVIFNQRRVGVAPSQKSVARERFVNLDISGSTTNGPWCLGVANVIRLRNVWRDTVDEGNNITNSFYIDHNQTENYYGLSYLYIRSSDANLLSGFTGNLIVEFDYLTSPTTGLKTVTSYPIDDTMVLPAGNIHTMEIPEVATRDGGVADLRECIDFRPIALPTTTPAADAGLATPVDPSELETLTFSNEVADNLLIPVPVSDVFVDLKFYQARTDTIILNANSIFEFAIGTTPSAVNTNELILYRANVPPYPSLPENLSGDLETIIDTRVINETRSNSRRDKYTIRTEQVNDQTQGYTMDHIAQLERRIEILEYYTNLTALENSVKDRIFPSSVDSTLDRFKFGFFVDNFADYSLTNTEDPEYNASIFAFVLQPAKYQFNIPLEIDQGSYRYVDGSKLHFPYEPQLLVRQEFATTGPAQVVIPDEPEAKTVCQFIEQASNKGSRDGDVFEDYTFTLASTPKANGMQVSCKFQAYGGVDRYEFYQTDDPKKPHSQWRLIGSNATLTINTLSTTEKSRLNNLNLFRNQGDGIYKWDAYGGADFARADRSGPSGTNYWVRFVGEISFPYEQQFGRYLKVRMIRATPVQAFYLCYPGDDIVDPIIETGGPETLPDPLGGGPITTTPTAPPRIGGSCPIGYTRTSTYVVAKSRWTCQPISCPIGFEVDLSTYDPNTLLHACVRVPTRTPARPPTITRPPAGPTASPSSGTALDPRLPLIGNRPTVPRPPQIRDPGTPKPDPSPSPTNPSVYTAPTTPTKQPDPVIPRPVTRPPALRGSSGLFRLAASISQQ